MTIQRIAVIVGLFLIAILAGLLGFGNLAATESENFQTEEYLTIRWSGRDNTHVIRPNGETESLGPLLSQFQRPDRVDERAWLMNIAINAASREGYQFAGMTEDRVVMKRAVRR